MAFILLTASTQFTWKSLGPLDHLDEVPLAELVEAGEQGAGRVGLAVVVASVHHLWLDGVQDVQEDQLGVEGQRGLGGDHPGRLDGGDLRHRVLLLRGPHLANLLQLARFTVEGKRKQRLIWQLCCVCHALKEF